MSVLRPQPSATEPKTIVLTGGGSGGHITPILAVAHQLKKLRPDVKLVYIGQKGEKLHNVIARSSDIDQVAYIWAGKWRRYHGEKWRQLVDIPTLAKNTRDTTRVARGIQQSRRLLKRLHPVGIFIKGGFVSVPVGVAAHQLHIPFITHDSDALPGLANRLIGRWALLYAVGMPPELYSYAPDKMRYTGVPIDSHYQVATEAEKKQIKQTLGLGGYSQVMLVTGGGLGAQRVNEALIGIAPVLLEKNPGLAIIHAVGLDHEKLMQAAYDAVIPDDQRKRVQVHGYIHDMYQVGVAADVVITRAGATNLAEWAALHKACIVIPNPLLTGGHQLKNTQAFVQKQAIIEVAESQLKDKTVLQTAIQQLLDDSGRRQQLGDNIAQFAKPAAAHELATLLLESFMPKREG
ncbi:MAG: UDP-N-acetylglucosamine--N-acetylmuramyl-(pentapeptide) pyrophosphoryl-undecaprenol [Candidatus Saccharibacteria bacterium]|nr:UDP-N-acetylglucosamine--N-acetylmuramyl-(pentapeptide) pyrophosphoryl-undecaprenol [Candidatus Saccharibacteria bacterium]